VPPSISIWCQGKIEVTRYRRRAFVLMLLGMCSLASLLTSCHSKFSLRTFLYAANVNSDNVSAYAVSPLTGALIQISSSPLSTGSASSPANLALHPSGEFLYVAGGPLGISGYRIDRSTGMLTAVQGSPFGDDGALIAALHPNGRFLLALYPDRNQLSVFAVDASGGALSPLASLSAGGNRPERLAMTPRGDLVYVWNQAEQHFAIFAFDADSGVLTPTPASPFPLGQGISGVRIVGTFLYVTDGVASVFAYSIEAPSGALTLVNGSPFPAGSGPTAITSDPLGRFLFVANAAPGSFGIAALRIASGNGSLTAVSGSPLRASDPPFALAVDPSGLLLYVANAESDNISAYHIDANTGHLMSLSARPFSAGDGPRSIVIVSTRTLSP
jgi:6-phosphogluconolactonase